MEAWTIAERDYARVVKKGQHTQLVIIVCIKFMVSLTTVAGPSHVSHFFVFMTTRNY